MATSRRRMLAVLAAVGLSVPLGGSALAAQQQDELSVLTLNTWHGGGQVHDGIAKIVRQIKDSGADAVALQETSADATKQIAEQLGWNHTSSGWDVDVLSAAPIEDTDQKSFPGSGAQAVAAKIHGIWVYSIHLDYTKYGPYNACFDGDSYPVIYQDEESRERQAQDIAGWAGSGPAIVSGDLNTPSHLDWTEATKARHCNSVVEWPATKVFADAGYRDSYRDANPDESASPGETWSPVVKWNDDYGEDEPQDRIDFVLYQGGSLGVTGSQTYGGGPDWPCDHLGVLTTFTY